MTQKKRGKSTSSKNRKTSEKSGTARSKGKNKIQQPGFDFGGEIMLILFALFCILMFFSCFGVCGAVGNFISNLLFGTFGYLAYLVPIVLFVSVCIYLANQNNLRVTIKIIACIFGVALFCGLLHGIIGNKNMANYGAVFEDCRLNHNGAGVVGAVIYGMLDKAIGAVGAFLVLITLMIIAAVIISEKSFVKGVKKSGRKVYDTAKEENNRRKERVEERRAQKRMDKDASGISMNVKMEKDNPRKKEEMKEILEEKAKEEIFLNPEMTEIPVKIAGKEVTENVSLNEVKEEIREEEEPIPVLQEEKPAVKRKQKTEKIEEEVVIPEIQETSVNVKQYQFPPLRLLAAPKGAANKNSAVQLRETAAKLQQILKDFGVSVTVTDVSCGPTVTRYELQPDHGVKVSKILALSDDIKLNLAVADIRIEAPIPGKAAIGIEVPNKENSTVTLRELLASEEFDNHASNLAFGVGKDIGGKTVITDIAKMPHLLIAGATGSGKSVCINTLIMSLLYKASPEDVKLIMIDPKVVELSTYNGIPHLLIPVVTDPRKAAGALNWAVAEMTRRYQLFAEYQVRNLQGYNEKVKSIEMLEDEDKPQKLPQIVIIVDELADLMMVAPGDVEDAICRLAQLARAAGIHLIIATQRPSVNVITGLIKANMPSRLAFAVSSGVDSRTILDMNGAEKLLGKGDMLFYPYGYPKPVRIQGAFVSDEEVNAVVEFLKTHNDAATVNSEIEEHLKKQQTQTAGNAKGLDDSSGGNDALFVEAGKFIIEKEKASIGMLQRWFKIGFNRAARIMDQLAEAGVVGEEQGTKPREILMSMEQFEQYIEEYL